MEIICGLLTAFLVLVFVRIVLSWFPPGGQLFESIQRFVFTATEWLMGPLRRVLPPVRLGAVALDLSPLVVVIGVGVLRSAICR
ncbi:MAG: YggT family protein [Acidimicrobiales bacterium]